MIEDVHLHTHQAMKPQHRFHNLSNSGCADDTVKAKSASSAWARAAEYLDCDAAAVGHCRPLADVHDHAVHLAVGGGAATAAAAQFRKPATGLQK